MLPVSVGTIAGALACFPQTLMPLDSARRTQQLIAISHFGATFGVTLQDKSAWDPAP
jgi:hypothetical protein